VAAQKFNYPRRQHDDLLSTTLEQIENSGQPEPEELTVTGDPWLWRETRFMTALQSFHSLRRPEP
jgi:hypothetical protein